MKRYNNLVKLLSIGTVALVMSGCGGGGSTEVSDVIEPPTTTEPPTTLPPVTEPSSPFDGISEPDGDVITVGTYSGFDEIIYYDLIMPTDGNLVIDTSQAFVSMYDANLNLIESDARGVHSLTADTYILKVEYFYGEGSTLTINSDVLYNQHDLPLLSTGTTTGLDGIQYYKIIMPIDGNLVIDTSGAFVAMYDINLNLIESDARGVHSLTANTYVIKVEYLNDEGSNITINSDVL